MSLIFNLTRERNLAALIVAIFIITSGCDSGNPENKGLAAKSGQGVKKIKLFNRLPPENTGVNFANMVTEDVDFNIINYHYFYNGGGVACGDINNDGLPDLYFTANQLPDKLYLNKGGMKFEDISDRLPLQEEGTWKTGVTMADVNADGFLDIYICRSGQVEEALRKNILLINDGQLGFTNKAKEFGLDDPAYSTQASFFDYDRDGDLDMFLLNHEIKDITNYNRQQREQGYSAYAGDKLYRNDNGTFKEVGKEAGINQNPYGFGLGVAVGDLNGDHWPDIYVTNDFLENDYLYLNNQNGTFRESIKESTKHGSNYGMGVDIADMNNDGRADILVVDMVAKDNYRQKTNMSGMNPERFWQSINFGFHYQYMYNTLQLNRGDEKFSEIGQMAGISNTDWSWSALMADFDNDGLKDIFITNGLRKEIRNNDFIKKLQNRMLQLESNTTLDRSKVIKELLNAMPSQKIPNYVYQNRGNLSFKEMTSEWGLSQASFSTGAIYADLDNDGDLDIVTNNVDDTAHVFKNNQSERDGNNYLTVQLQGPAQNNFGIGAIVEIKTTTGSQTFQVNRSRGFQSSIPASVHFGLGSETKIAKLKVIWPDGKVSSTGPLNSNQALQISYVDAKTENSPFSDSPTMFRDITEELNISYLHVENPYDDFKDQVLLPHKLSNLGPALAVGDVNGDGLDDFFVGSSSGQSAGLFFQTSTGQFSKSKGPFPPSHSAYEDVDAIFFDSDMDGDLDLYVCSGSYEFDSTSVLLVDRLYENDGKGHFNYLAKALPDLRTSTSCVRPYDIDNDGDLDLFVGGRLVPKGYPFSPRSYILENESGIFVESTSKIAPDLLKIGMVTDAEWADLDGDGIQELLVAGEWMALKLFELNDGLLKEMKTGGLEYSNGWWFNIQPVDIDQDGDMDIVGGNLGLNYKYKASVSTPFKIYGDDFDKNQSVDVVLSYAENGTYYPVRGRECSSQQMPFIKEKFPDYKSFGSASLHQILGAESLEESLELNAYTFATSIFENQGNGNFTIRPMHPLVQLSSVNDIAVQDLNKDGYPDLIMGGNLYGAEVETPRNDASYGNILLSDSKGNMNGLPAASSGFFGEGEVKKIKKMRLAGGKQVFLIARNNAPLRAFVYE